MQELPEPFFARCISRSDQVVLKLGGECDVATLEQLNDALREVVGQQQKEVIVDMARVTFIDSMTLGALTAAAKQVREKGRSFKVMRTITTEVRRAFEITGLDDYLLVPPPGRS
jgi:anti-anti-sigma factor